MGIYVRTLLYFLYLCSSYYVFLASYLMVHFYTDYRSTYHEFIENNVFFIIKPKLCNVINDSWP